MRASALLLVLQVIGPFDLPALRPWERDTSENVLRQVHQGAFEGRTTVWVRIRPKADDPHVAPTTFVFVAEFPGTSVRARQPVTWQVETNVKYYPLLQRTARLEVSIDGAPPVDLLAEEGPSVAQGHANKGAPATPSNPVGVRANGSVGYCCGDTPIPTSVTVALSADRLDRLAAATSVSGNALGVPFTLDRQQLDVIAGFRRRLLPER